MAYSRWGNGELYVYLSAGGYFTCTRCPLDPAFTNFTCGSTAEMVAHLAAHTAAGHTFSPDALRRLEEDREENDAWLANPTEAP